MVSVIFLYINLWTATVILVSGIYWELKQESQLTSRQPLRYLIYLAVEQIGFKTAI